MGISQLTYFLSLGRPVLLHRRLSRIPPSLYNEGKLSFFLDIRLFPTPAHPLFGFIGSGDSFPTLRSLSLFKITARPSSFGGFFLARRAIFGGLRKYTYL